MAPGELVDERLTEDLDRDARSDLELIAAINGGDPAAFEVLYFRYRDWVAGLAFRLTNDSDAALDVLQETFLYVLRKFPGFRLTVHFKTFLYPAVRNLSIAARRKAARFQAREEELRHFESTATAPANPPFLCDLEALLATLPEEQREVLLLRFVDGLSLAEIGEAMGTPVGTVKSRLHNALQTLRQDERTRDFFAP
jgi:RNA polymerase sigma-70 factor, ECF subfamily